MIRYPNSDRLRFGWQEWIGMAALALVPGMGFASWAFAMSNRVTKLETIVEYQATAYAQSLDDSRVLIRLTAGQEAIIERQKQNRERIERLEARK